MNVCTYITEEIHPPVTYLAITDQEKVSTFIAQTKYLQ